MGIKNMELVDKVVVLIVILTAMGLFLTTVCPLFDDNVVAEDDSIVYDNCIITDKKIVPTYNMGNNYYLKVSACGEIPVRRDDYAKFQIGGRVKVIYHSFGRYWEVKKV